jgi:hypothetical protein
LRQQANATTEGLAAKEGLNAKTRKQGDNDHQDKLFVFFSQEKSDVRPTQT